MILTPNIGFKIFQFNSKTTITTMRKLLFIIGIMALVGCQKESLNEDLAINEPIYGEGDIIDPPIAEEAQDPGEETPDETQEEETESDIATWTDGEINIVLTEDLIALEYDTPLKELATDFYDLTGVEVVFYDKTNHPENYVNAQYAFFNSSYIGMKGGKQNASFNDRSITQDVDLTYLTFAQMAGVENPEGNAEFTQDIIDQVKALYAED